jgi:uncharacterized protein (DUF1800 family)/fibronectin type 3 domain-containing protein
METKQAPSRACAWILLVSLGIACQAALAAPAEQSSTSPSTDVVVLSAAPEGVTAEAGDARVVLSWRAVEGAAGYHVFRSIDGAWEADSIASVSDTTYTNTGLANDTAYTFAVAAYNTAGTGPRSTAVIATPIASPAAITASVVTTTSIADAAPVPEQAVSTVAGNSAAPLFVPVAGTRSRSGGEAARAAPTEQPTTPDTVMPRAQPPASSSTSAPASAPSETAPAPAPTASASTPLPESSRSEPIAPAETTRSEAAPAASDTTGDTAIPAPADTTEPEPAAVPERPGGLRGAAGDGQVTLSWHASAGASTYTVYRSTSTATDTFAAIAAGVAALSYVDPGLTNGTRYYYRVRAVSSEGASDMSTTIGLTPVDPAPTEPPANLVATPGGSRIVLTWNAVARATSYRVYRTTTNVFDRQWIATVTTPAYANTGLTNGIEYSYRVAARNAGGDGPLSAIVSAAPIAAPPAPEAVAATVSHRGISVKWAAAPRAATYNVYRATTSGGQGSAPFASGISGTEFVDANVGNGPTYYYKVTAVNSAGESPRSMEASGVGDPPAPVVDAATQAAFRLLRQATWGARAADIDRVKEVGAENFIGGQLAVPPSVYPDSLFDRPIEWTQEYFMQLALTGPDQLRQRVAWALHKIWVVSAVEVPDADAIITYYRLLMAGAFGNYRDLMRAVTLNPAMGRYLNMLNNRSQQVTGVPPNENYARELMQLFTLGLTLLNPDGTPVLDSTGRPVAAYTETDVQELARILTGWTFGSATREPSTNWNEDENYRVPMRPIEEYHDSGAKFFLGQPFPAGQTATQDLEQALDLLFNHPNLAPFVSRQLIQQLVTSNPSPAYVAAVTETFNSPNRRGDLALVVRAILLHPEAQAATAASGKLAEPVLFVVAPLRTFGAVVADHPFMSDRAERMGQKVFFPPSVFSYFSPGYRVRGTAVGNGPPLGGPEFQILTSVTALERANYLGSLLGGDFGDDVAIDYSPFTSRATDPAALVDYCNLVFLGGRMSAVERQLIIDAVRASSTRGSVDERTRTALYLTLTLAQSQIDR